MFKNRIAGLVILIIIGTIVSQCTSADRNSSGEISKSGDLNVTETRLGDCFVDLPDVTTELTNISSVNAVPCSEPHSWQVFHKTNLLPGEYSEDAVIDAANEVCDLAVEALVTSLSDLEFNEYRTADISIIQPIEKTWASGNRAVDCLIGSDTQTYYSSVLD
jgi:hypothetical protein